MVIFSATRSSQICFGILGNIFEIDPGAFPLIDHATSSQIRKKERMLTHFLQFHALAVSKKLI